MKADLCALTDELLPLYTEGLLTLEMRGRIDEHALECPACRERLERAATTLAPPPGAVARTRKPRPQVSARMRRMLIWLLIGIMIAGGGIGYAVNRKSPVELVGIPSRVNSADDLATRGIPGWTRAKRAGLVVNLGITQPIGDSDATVTLEKAWYSGRQAYILYTVKAPKDHYILPGEAYVNLPGSTHPSVHAITDSYHFNQWGGFSAEGFHGVLSFPRLEPGPETSDVKLTIRRWVPVTPDTGMARQRSSAAQLEVLLPLESAYLQEGPPQDVITWNRQQSWMGRTLTVTYLQVGIGSTTLDGLLTLPAVESKPWLHARLHVAGRVLDLKEFTTELVSGPSNYRFRATFDGVDRWPAPVTLELTGISFQTAATLEWPFNWAKYGHLKEAKLMDPADQVTVPFYDSKLVSIVTMSRGISVEQRDPGQKPPYVRANLGYGSEGMQLLNDPGDVLTGLGSGGGTIYDDGRDERQGVAAMWDDSTLPESFRKSDRLTLRYVNPGATLVLKETWEVRSEP